MDSLLLLLLLHHDHYFSFPITMIITITIPLFIILLIYFLISWIPNKSLNHLKNKLKQQPPEPAGSWPIIGHLHLLAGNPTLPHVTLGSLADKYGPIFTIRLGVRKAVVISSWELVKECFTTHDRIFASRPRSVATKHMGYNYAMFGFSPYGPYWRELRKISNRELLSNRQLELLKHVWDAEIKSCVKELYEVWLHRISINASSEIRCSASGVMVDMKRCLGELTLNMSLRLVAGKRCFGATNNNIDDHHELGDDDDDEEMRRSCQKGMGDFFRLVGLFVISDSIPLLGWLDLGGYEKEMKKTAKELDCLLQRWLDEHKLRRRRRLNNGSTESTDDDFMSVLLEILEDAKLSDSEYDADTINKATCLGLIMGGSDTIMVSLVWALSLLLNNQQVLEKAHDELDIHVGKERQVDESDIKNLIYLRAIVKETLRLYPAGPLSGPREATEDCTLAGYHIQAGTRLIVNTWKIQRDPRVWANPYEFKPERFLTTHEDVDVKGQNFELIPFGSGRRSCPGTSLALQVVHLTLARLIHGFKFETGSGDPVDMTESVGLTNAKATPLEVMVTPRLPSKLYL